MCVAKYGNHINTHHWMICGVSPLFFLKICLVLYFLLALTDVGVIVPLTPIGVTTTLVLLLVKTLTRIIIAMMILR